jgi:cellulose synthase/poly-beta-1,6-N-acetylglucosamine synthase-like glycosyltransferase
MSPDAVALGVVLLPAGLFAYAYFLYPGLLWTLGRVRKARPDPPVPATWPAISIVVPAYNEERAIRRTIDSLLALDYPADRRQILIISDASTDGTDDVVRSYLSHGVELLRLPQRSGKTVAEAAALPRLTGEIVVNTDATIRILPESLKPLIRALEDPAVGVASGRDVSVSDLAAEANAGESGYVGYEMWVRAQETRVGSIVGASGCFYAIRRALHGTPLPGRFSRDFASALVARENGYRAVSVDPAVCLVPRTGSLQREYRRKVRTMARGLQTLWFKRHLLNPFRYGLFAWMLCSHKLVRWLLFPAVPLAVLALAYLSLHHPLALALLLAALGGAGLGAFALRASEGRALPKVVTLSGFVLASHVAGVQAWIKAIRGENQAIWEPTRRSA